MGQRQTSRGNAGERQLAIRPAPSPIERLLARADEARELTAIARRGIRFVEECYSPNNREPFSIGNRRSELQNAVKAYKARRAPKRAA